jgi:hypothetical protein
MTQPTFWFRVLPAAIGLCFAIGAAISLAEDPPADPTAAPAANPATPATAPADPQAEPAAQPANDPPGLVRLSKDFDVWIDPKRKFVVVDGKVSLRQGQLEMFACPKGTKEHESVVAVNSKASFVHAGLLAVGAKPGSPVKFQPEYTPANGTEIDIWVLWKDKDGNNKKVRAQEWVRNIKTEKALEYPWVFAGSGFWTDEADGQQYYHGDGGDFICVSNFPAASLDLPVQSSQQNDDLSYEAFTEHIPEKGTHVRLVLIPKLPKEEKPGADE